MKNVFTILVFFMTLNWAFAQNIEISEAPRAKNNGTYMSFLFELPDVDQTQAEEDWKKFVDNFKAKTKYDKKNKIWFSDDAKMPRLSDGTVDIHARILEDGNPNKKTTVIVWFDLGDSYVNSETDSLKGIYAREILSEYAMITSREQAEAVLKAEEKRLDELEKDLSKLKKDNKNYRKEIEKARDAITKNEKNIEINELDQKNKDKEIEAQKAAIKLAKTSVKKFVN